MTRFTRRNHGGGHSYRLDGQEIPGVTTIIGTLDKPALVGWAASETAAYADEHWTRLTEMRSADRIKELEKARFQTNRAAVVKGNRIHALGEDLANGLTVEVPPEIQPQVEAYARFLDQWQIEPLTTESPVCSTEWGYAGTLDAIVESPRLGRVLLDVKTGKVYSDVALQLNAYATANVILIEEPQVGPRGGKLPSIWVEEPMPEVDRLMVAHVRDTTVELLPVAYEPWISEVFLHLLEVHMSWLRRTAWKHRDQADWVDPIGDPVWPEDHPLLAQEGADS